MAIDGGTAGTTTMLLAEVPKIVKAVARQVTRILPR